MQLQVQEAIGTVINDDAAPTNLYLLDGLNRLFLVNTATAAITQIGTIPLRGPVIDIVSDQSGRLLSLDSLASPVPNNLYTTNLTTLATSFVSPVLGFPGGVSEEEGDAAFDVVDGNLYAVFDTNPQRPPELFRINVATGAVTNVGNITVGGTNLAQNNDDTDMNYLGYFNGTLYCALGGQITGPHANFANSLFTINPNTGAATLVGPLGVTLSFGGTGGGMDYDPISGNFYLMDSPSGLLYAVSPVTGRQPWSEMLVLYASRSGFLLHRFQLLGLSVLP